MNIFKTYSESGELSDAISSLAFCEEHAPFLGIELGNEMRRMFPNSISLLTSLAKMYRKVNREDECFTLCNEILSLNSISDDVFERITSLRNECVLSPLIKDKFINYPEEIIRKINRKSVFPLITFSITTASRFDLFERTMNSFLQCCLDLSLISEWILIDDNSPSDEIRKMGEKYPFFRIITKNVTEKGHVKSMNLLLKEIRTPYWFHMEDDWQFFEQRNYLTECLSVLSENKTYGQCLINKNYAEIPNEKLIGGIPKRTEAGYRYSIHEYASSADYPNFYKKHGNGLNSAYWPHYSLRPSLLRVSAIREIGEFNEQSVMFEMEFAYRYFRKYVSTFLHGYYSIHIGKLTSERNKTCGDLKTYVINLDKRKDRLISFCSQSAPKFLNYERFPAIEYSKLDSNSQQFKRLFTTSSLKKPEISLFVTTVQLLINLLASDYSAFCIFEDDMVFPEKFENEFLRVRKTLPTNWDICYLTHVPYSEEEKGSEFKLVKMDSNEAMRISKGGTMAYLISRSGAEKLLAFIDTHGAINAIDTVQLKCELNRYYCSPRLGYAPTTDSDIQSKFEYFPFSEDGIVKEEAEYYKSKNLRVRILNHGDDIDLTTEDVLIHKGVYEGTIDYPSYTLYYGKITVIIRNGLTDEIRNERCFNHLKRNGKYSIRECILV